MLLLQQHVLQQRKMFFFRAKAQPCWCGKPCKESWPQPWLIICGFELCESVLKVAVSGPYLSSSSGHIMVTGASRCDLNPLRRGGNTDVKRISRPIKLQIHNVTVIRFSVPDVLLRPAQRLTTVSVSRAQASTAHQPACYWLNQIIAGVGRGS